MVVDNASTDGSSAYVREYFPEVRVHDAGGNLGFSGGNNAGARQARGRLLVFLNNDTVVASDWLGRLVRCARRPSGVWFRDVADRVCRRTSGGSTAPETGTCLPAAPSSVATARRARRFRRSARSVRRLRLRDGHEARAVRGARRIRSDPSSSSTRTSICRIARSSSGARCWYARRCGRPPRRQRDDGPPERSRGVLWAAQPRVDLAEEHTRVIAAALVASSHAIYSAAGVAYYAKQGLLWPALKGKFSCSWRGSRGCSPIDERVQRERRTDLLAGSRGC